MPFCDGSPGSSNVSLGAEITRAGTTKIAVDPKPVDRRHVVDSASFEIELAVTARNSDARRYRVVVHYDGGWGDDIWRHLSVQAPQRLH